MLFLNWWKSTSLGIRIAIWLMLLSLFSMLTVGYVVYFNGKNVMEEQAKEHLSSVVALKSQEVSGWYNELEQDIVLLALSPDLAENYARLLEQSQEQMRQSQSYQKLGDFLQRQLANEEDFSEFFIMDTEGRIVISTDGEQEGKYKANRPYFVNGRESTFVQNVYHSLTLGEPALTISTPVKDEKSAVIGVLAGRAELGQLSEIMGEYSGLGETGDTYLVNRYNFFVTEPRFGDGYALRKGIHTEGVKECLAGRSGTKLYEGYHGASVLGAYEWLPERELGLIAEKHQSEAFAPIDRLRGIVRLIIGAIMAVCVGLGILLGRIIVRPIGQLVRGVTAVAAGNLDYRVRMESETELSWLAAAFNSMADSLKERTERLQMAVIDAQAASRAKSEFLSSVSHELRTPLTAVIGLSELLQKQYYGTLNEKQAEYVEDILNSSRHLHSLINDILDLAKIEAGKSSLELTEARVEELMESSLLLVKESATRSKVSVQLEITKQVLNQKITVDKRRFRQVMANLLSNAIKFTPSGGKVVVEAKKRQDDLIVSVSDTGIGISPEDQEKIFNAFYQVSAGTTGKSPGTGLGLSLAKRLLEEQDGKIWVKSEGIGKGSCFSFTIPLRPPSREPGGR